MNTSNAKNTKNKAYKSLRRERPNKDGRFCVYYDSDSNKMKTCSGWFGKH